MGVFKSLRRRRWRNDVNVEFRGRYGVDLRTVGEVIGPTTLRNLLNDEYELSLNDPAVGARDVAQMLVSVYRVDIASLGMRDLAHSIPAFDGLRSSSARPHSRVLEPEDA